MGRNDYEAYIRRVQEWREKFLSQVAHLSLLEGESLVGLKAAELVELTICGQIDPHKEDYMNPEERKPVLFQEWSPRCKEDGGGQIRYQTPCGKYIKTAVYVFGRRVTGNHNPNDTTFVVCTTIISDNGNAHPDPESHKSFDTNDIAGYKVLERY